MKRKDGRPVESIEPILKLFPYVLAQRCDSQVFMKETILADPIDEYIKIKNHQGIKMSYLHYFVAAYVRTIAERPKLNRFIVDSKVYARNNIQISMTIKKKLIGEAPEVTAKFTFKGTETIEEVTEIINNGILHAINSDDVEIEKFCEKIVKLPHFLKKAITGTILFMDRHGMLPMSVINESPFHSTAYITYLKSIKQDYIFHHLYNVGTTGVFVAIGKVVEIPISIKGNVESRRCVQIGYTADERICDGLYLATSLRLAKKYLENPTLLETPLPNIVEDEK